MKSNKATLFAKDTYGLIFVILVYRNTDDIIYLLRDIQAHCDNFKVIIVNSYYDEKTKEIFQNIARKFNCDFLNIPNKGYGYGNNRGIEHAHEKYDFQYLAIANPDILIKKFSIASLWQTSDSVICPVIVTLAGRRQNPLWVIRNNFSEWLIYQGYRKKIATVRYVGVAINKAIRELFLRWFFHSKAKTARIYAPHGSFLIFPSAVLKNLRLPFDEEMFLFSEEMYLARRLKSMNIPTIMTKDIEITHKQDGSVSLAKVNELSESLKSYLYYYSHRERIDREGR